MKPFMSWMGGKLCLLNEIITRFPKDFRRNKMKYIEVFGGGGAVLFGKKESTFEVYNDFNGHLVNLFRVVKERPFEFLQELGIYNLNSRTEFGCLKLFLNDERVPYTYLKENLTILDKMLPPLEKKQFIELYSKHAEDRDLQRAVNFYKLISYSFASGGSSWSAQKSTIIDVSDKVTRCSHRLRSVVIENKDFEQLFKQYDEENAFFYCDPPYYEAEYYEACFTEQDHRRLKNVLANIKGKFMLSYNDCPFIRELYKDFYMIGVERNNSISNKKGSVYKELIIGNYDLREKNEDGYDQMAMENYLMESEENVDG